MRILYSSNAMWANTGYGVQAKHLLPRLLAMGHEVAQFAWYGLQGAQLNIEGIRIYPRAREPWGNDIVGAHAADWDADLLISLQDIQMLPPDYRERAGVPWLAWFPVDQAPAPPSIVEMARKADYPTVYSRWGREVMAEAGVETHYVPHGVDTNVFRPVDRQAARKRLGWDRDAFWIVMVAANKGFPSRKSFPEALAAFARFHERRPDARLYLHTESSGERNGVDFELLMGSIDDFPREAVEFVDQYRYVTGLPEEYMALAYNAGDVLLQPSKAEGFGIPIVEAQACGTPVLTNACTAMPEITFAGLSLEPLQKEWTQLGGWVGVPDVDAFVEGLEWAYQHRGDDDLAEIARAEAMAFDWDFVVERYWAPLLQGIARTEDRKRDFLEDVFREAEARAATLERE